MMGPAVDDVKIEMYSTGLCPYCVRARMLLEQKGVEYVEYRVDVEKGLRGEMEDRSQRHTVPQIFIGNRHIGGFEDLAELDVDEELDSLLGLHQNV